MKQQPKRIRYTLVGAGNIAQVAVQPAFAHASENSDHSGVDMGSAKESAADFVPSKPTLSSLRKAATECRGCRLWQSATQTVFGEGNIKAHVMLVGEQPGNDEDLSGHPFVGPAGRLLDRALEQAGIDRASVYVTNVVKHFKWVPRGKRRMHSKPIASEIVACRPWLDEEVRLIKPKAIVCLGATAAQSLLGKSFKVTQSRGVPQPSSLASLVVATVHPSSILRAATDRDRHNQFEAFVNDLRSIVNAGIW